VVTGRPLDSIDHRILPQVNHDTDSSALKFRGRPTRDLLQHFQPVQTRVINQRQASSCSTRSGNSCIEFAREPQSSCSDPAMSCSGHCAVVAAEGSRLPYAPPGCALRLRTNCRSAACAERSQLVLQARSRRQLQLQPGKLTRQPLEGGIGLLAGKSEHPARSPLFAHWC